MKTHDVEKHQKDGSVKILKMFEMSEAQYRDLSNDNGGLCLSCGEISYCCEPDARGYACEACDENRVYGLDECLLMGRIDIVGDDEGEEDE